MVKRRLVRCTQVFLLAPLWVQRVGDGANTPRSQAPVAQLTIEAADFSFRAPRRVVSGWTTIRLHNLGPSFHHVVLLRLKPGERGDSALADLMRRHGDPDRAIPGTVSIGGPEGRMPSGDSFATVNLLVGEYLIVCTIPKDGRPHAAIGMSAVLSVAKRVGQPVSPPAADMLVRLSDYSYTVSQSHLAPGWRTLRVENVGPAEHIAELAKLNDGRTAADMVKALDGTGPEPMVTIGGSTRVAVGGVSYVHANLTPGRYVIFCMLHDRADRIHVKLGMLKEFIVD